MSLPHSPKSPTSRAESTQYIYHLAFTSFESWCQVTRLPSLPTTLAIVKRYVLHLSKQGKSLHAIRGAITAIAHTHQSHGHPWPHKPKTILQAIPELSSPTPSSPRERISAIDGEMLQRLVASLDHDLRGLRDRAVLCLGWWGAFRSTELLSLQVEDLSLLPDGLLIRVPNALDAQGKPWTKTLPYYAVHPPICPVQTLLAWLQAASLHQGPLFRGITKNNGRLLAHPMNSLTLRQIVQRATQKVGLAPGTFSPHSLRSGFCVTAARQGKPIEAIMAHTGQKTFSFVQESVRLAPEVHPNAAFNLFF